jgi:protein phosphatase
MVGKKNEDRFAVTSYQCSQTDATPVLFAVVADGIGGHRAGEVAAELAVDHISEVVEASDGRHPLQTLEKAIHVASEAIADHAVAAPGKEGMGATCACVWVMGDRLYTAWVGDTRIYLFRDDRIQQLTVDHSWVQEAMERGILTPEQARHHPNVHVIRRYLGSPEPPEVDFRLRLSKRPGDTLAENNQGAQLLPGDTLLLCTDGLSDLVWNDEIAEILRARGSLKEAAHALIDSANQRGGHDNSTVILLSVPRNGETKRRGKKNRLPWILGGIAGLLLGAASAAVLSASLLRLVMVSTPTPTARPAVIVAAPWTAAPATTRTPALTPTPSATPAPLTPRSTLTPWPTNTLPSPDETQT